MIKLIHVLFFLILMLVSNVSEARVYIFYYPKAQLKIGIDADGYLEAFKKAARECFKILSKDKYQGEEKGLDIIDICANPEDGSKMKEQM